MIFLFTFLLLLLTASPSLQADQTVTFLLQNLNHKPFENPSSLVALKVIYTRPFSYGNLFNSVRFLGNTHRGHHRAGSVGKHTYKNLTYPWGKEKKKRNKRHPSQSQL